jgi:hypothetical protein
MNGHLRDISTTITTGGTAQALLAVGVAKVYLLIHNPRTETESLLINAAGATAVSGNAVELAPGGTMVFENAFVSSSAVSVLAATTGHKVVAWVN